MALNRNLSIRYTLAYLIVLSATATLAHEVWLAPASFRVAAGAAVPLRLLVGANFAGEAWPRPLQKVQRLVRLGPASPADSTDLRPVLLADSLAPLLRCPTPGTHLVVLTSQLAFVELPAAQFTAYLRAEGLDYALRQRQEADQTTRPGREAYRRCAKALVYAAPGEASRPLPSAADTAFRRVLGLPLELVPEQNPFGLRPGAALTVRVLQRGQPAPGALVQAWDASPLPPPARHAPAPPPRHFTTHTNAQGRALLRLPGPGPYLLATVRIEAAPASLASRAEWLSTWASLTFGGPSTAIKPHYSQTAN